ncbi:MAG: hypothetical protein KDK48_04130 [Chlamydiia bacterium]|nr:hypothetical protein [Chlamydiia bacterium]
MNFTLEEKGPFSREYLSLGARTFLEALEWTHALPFGRNSDRTNFELIFTEKRGTCSTKHAALGALTLEMRAPAILKLAFHLKKFDRFLLPEAHVYLALPDEKIDITIPGSDGKLHIEILEEHNILPSEIGERKSMMHELYLKRWLKSHPEIPLSAEEILKLREQRF